MLTKSPAARTALVYVTAGALMIIWTIVWFIFLRNNPPEGNWPYYLIGGLLASGLTMLGIGLGVGRLGSAARNADNPAVVVTPTNPPVTTAVMTPPPAPTSASPSPVSPPPASVAVASRTTPGNVPVVSVR